ncbi:MAG: GAF domain-containing protein [Chloroflexota bacterium]|nr:GAF domain-containing protein [Chloroflexota bacterium]
MAEKGTPEKVDQPRRELLALGLAARETSRSLNLEDMLERIVPIVGDLFHASHSCVVLVDNEGKDTSFVENTPDAPTTHLARHCRFWERAMATGEPEAVAEVKEDEENRTASPNARIKSYAAVPIKVDAKTVGAICIHSPSPQAFNNPLPLLNTLADQIAIAIKNTLLRRESEERAQWLGAMNELTRTIGSSLEIQEVYGAFITRIKKLVDIDWASIGLIDESGEKLQFLALYPELESTWSPGDAIPLAGTATEWVAQNKKPHLEEDLGRERQFWTDEALLKRGIRSILRLPLLSKSQVMGVFVCGSSHPRAYGERDVRVLEELTGQMAPVIENARLFRSLKVQMERLESTQAQLVQAEKLAAIGRLAANIAHEINNPLTGILMASSLLLEETPDDNPRKPDLETIKRETLRARDIVQNLLTFARPSEGNREKVDLSQIIQGAVALLRHQLDLRGVKLTKDYATDILVVWGDKNQITQVLYNLMINALDAMPQGGKLTLKSQAEKQWATIEVIDTGVGISPENLDRVFEPFFTTKARSAGTGLGLSVAYNIVDRFRGKIEVESQVGKGSTFRVKLPIRSEVKDETASTLRKSSHSG